MSVTSSRVRFPNTITLVLFSLRERKFCVNQFLTSCRQLNRLQWDRDIQLNGKINLDVIGITVEAVLPEDRTQRQRTQ